MILLKNISIFLLTVFVVFSFSIAINGISWLQLSYSQQPQQQNDSNTFAISNLSNNIRDSTYPQTESSKNNVYITWQDNMFGLNRLNYDILFKSSTDGGKTFGDVINLSNNLGFSEHPQMAVNETNVYIVWADNTSLNRDVYFVSSTDGGKTFGDVINLSNNTADSYNQEISVSGDNVYVTWLNSQKFVQGNNMISFVSSTDGGKTFGDVINLSKNAEKSSFPKISSSQNSVYITWNVDDRAKAVPMNNNNNSNNQSIDGVEEGIYFVKSVDKGKSFSDVIHLTTEEKPGEAQIASTDKNVYIIWGSPDPATTSQKDNSNDQGGTTGDGFYFIKSNDGGNSFLKPEFIKEDFINPLNVEIVEHFGQLILAIQATSINNTIEGNQDIFIIKSQDQGRTFSNATNISNNKGISECPSMTIPSDKDLFIIWQDKSSGNNEVFSTRINL